MASDDALRDLLVAYENGGTEASWLALQNAVGAHAQDIVARLAAAEPWNGTPTDWAVERLRQSGWRATTRLRALRWLCGRLVDGLGYFSEDVDEADLGRPAHSLVLRALQNRLLEFGPLAVGGRTAWAVLLRGELATRTTDGEFRVTLATLGCATAAHRPLVYAAEAEPWRLGIVLPRRGAAPGGDCHAGARDAAVRGICRQLVAAVPHAARALAAHFSAGPLPDTGGRALTWRRTWTPGVRAALTAGGLDLPAAAADYTGLLNYERAVGTVAAGLCAVGLLALRDRLSELGPTRLAAGRLPRWVFAGLPTQSVAVLQAEYAAESAAGYDDATDDDDPAFYYAALAAEDAEAALGEPAGSLTPDQAADLAPLLAGGLAEGFSRARNDDLRLYAGAPVDPEDYYEPAARPSLVWQPAASWVRDWAEWPWDEDAAPAYAVPPAREFLTDAGLYLAVRWGTVVLAGRRCLALDFLDPPGGTGEAAVARVLRRLHAALDGHRQAVPCVPLAVPYESAGGECFVRGLVLPLALPMFAWHRDLVRGKSVSAWASPPAALYPRGRAVVAAPADLTTTTTTN